MKASILIPAYNAAQNLEATLLSCVDQGADVVQEIIVVDDHSEDDSKAVFNRVATAHPEFAWKWAINPNKGACSARNHALSISTGECTQWLDSDDLLGTNKILNALKSLEDNPDQLVACPWRPFINELKTGLLPDFVDWVTIPDFSTPADWIARDTYMGLHCYFGHRNLFEQAGPWDESLAINQDGEYLTRVVAGSSGVLFTKESQVYYRRSSSNSVSKFSPEKAISLFRSTESMAQTGLAVEDSKRMQQMISNRWQHFIYTAYPHAPELLSKAQSKLQHLPTPTLSNPNAVSLLSKTFCALFGWKALTRAREYRDHLRGK